MPVVLQMVEPLTSDCALRVMDSVGATVGRGVRVRAFLFSFFLFLKGGESKLDEFTQ